MGLEEVKEDVLQQADVEVKRITTEAEQEAIKIREKAKVEIEQYHQEAEKRIKNLIEATERKMLAASRLESQRLLMNTKKDLIEEVINKVAENVIKLKKDEKKKFLQKLVKEAKDEIKVATVLVNKADVALLTGNKIDVQVTEIKGGLIAETKDQTVSVNLSLEELLEMAKSNLLIEISEVLFSDQ